MGKVRVVLKLHGNLPPREIQLNILTEVEAIGLISHYYFIAIIIIRLKKHHLDFKAEQLHKIKVTSSLRKFGTKLKFPHPDFICLNVSMIIEDSEKSTTQ